MPQSRPDVALLILSVVAEHEGEWSWTQIERAISHGTAGHRGPFITELNQLVADGLVESRRLPDRPDHRRYFLTETGREMIRGAPAEVEPVPRPDPTRAWPVHEGDLVLHERSLHVLEAASVEELPARIALGSRYFSALICADFGQLEEETQFALARTLVESGCIYACTWGPDCERFHDVIDWVCAAPEVPLVMTTWHDKDSLTETIWFLLNCATIADAETAGDCRAKLGLVLDNPEWAREIRDAFRAPEAFNARVAAIAGRDR
jgi:DNA-binding PadR family transcriptional regulator